MIHVLAIITALPGQREAVLTHFRAIMPTVHAEDGCIEYGPATDSTPKLPMQTELGPDSFVVIEKWRDLDALQTHGAAAHMAAYGAATRPMVATRVIHVLSDAAPG